jgi:hypothetical protein
MCVYCIPRPHPSSSGSVDSQEGLGSMESLVTRGSSDSAPTASSSQTSDASGSHASLASDSSSYAEPSPLGHRRAQSDGGTHGREDFVHMRSRHVVHSPRADSRLLLRARQLWERLSTAQGLLRPGPPHPSFCMRDLVAWLVSAGDFSSQELAGEFVRQLQSVGVVSVADVCNVQLPSVADVQCREHFFFHLPANVRRTSTSMMVNPLSHLFAPTLVSFSFT